MTKWTKLMLITAVLLLSCDGNTYAQTTTDQKNWKHVITFEDSPSVGSNITGNPQMEKWLQSKGIKMEGTPEGRVWNTEISGLVKTGVVIGYMSGTPFDGLDGNEVLKIHLLRGRKINSIGVTLMVVPSSYVNNQPSTVTLNAFDASGHIIGTTTKTFIGVTNNTFTPSDVTLQMNANHHKVDIDTITLSTSQTPYGGVYLKQIMLN